MDIHDHLYTQVTSDKPFLYELWEPNGLAVVIGYSQKAEREALVVRCRPDGVPIIRRRGGGGAVVLMPGILCLTLAFTSDQSISPYYFFEKINNALIDILEKYLQIQGLCFSGISDISLNNRKVMGCSMFKSRNLFFYQGSLLVDPNLEKISRYLKHPSKEPDYRDGRVHDEFVTSLHRQGYNTPVDKVMGILNRNIKEKWPRLLL